jgi:hypothetical protein
VGREDIGVEVVREDEISVSRVSALSWAKENFFFGVLSQDLGVSQVVG